MFDFSNEEQQKEFSAAGPVPGGSIVMVEMEVQMPDAAYQAMEDSFIYKTRSEMRQLKCVFTVIAGRYEGVRWYENITLPLGMQHVDLNPNQTRACRIGGAILKAILASAGKPPRIQNVRDFSGLRFPVMVKINRNPAERIGRVFWNNAIYKVITPDMEPQYANAQRKGEIINENGPVTGDGKAAPKSSAYSGGNEKQPFGGSESANIDDYVF